jgi:hypothetical protein
MLTVFRALQQVIEIDPAQAETKEASGSRIPLTSAPSIPTFIVDRRSQENRPTAALFTV